MTDTITGISTTQVTLSGTADNPATIVGTAVLDVGLYATALSGVAWTITNAGSILDGVSTSTAARGLPAPARWEFFVGMKWRW